MTRHVLGIEDLGNNTAHSLHIPILKPLDVVRNILHSVVENAFTIFSDAGLDSGSNE
jgi:hypothetical protein